MCFCQRDGHRKKAAPKHFCWTYHGHASLVVLNNSLGTLVDRCQQTSEVVGRAFVLNVNHLLSHGTHSDVLSGAVWPASVSLR